MSLDYRCPRCGRLYPRSGYVCLGGWETYPERGGSAAAPHAGLPVIPAVGPEVEYQAAVRAYRAFPEAIAKLNADAAAIIRHAIRADE